MNETKQDIERRQRLQEWFRSDPDIWEDLLEEGKISLNNELIQMKSRTCTSREWSAGYVSGQEFLLNVGNYFRRVWTAPQQK